MNFVSAEITKLAVNTYVTTKISFANMIARLCECLPGADASSVTGALGLDSRIGPKYLKGAVSYGGPCFPRDNRAMAALATRAGAFSELAEVTDRLNRAQVKWIGDLTKRHYSGSGPIGILGLTYKPDTDVVEESFGLQLAGELASGNVPVVAYDPSAEEGCVRAVNEKVQFVGSAQECVEKSDVVVIATPWAQFHHIPPQTWARHSPSRTVIDCWRAYAQLEGVKGVRYVRLGFGEEAKRAAETVSSD
jgi:UDPglucose 6-dehydrogenase